MGDNRLKEGPSVVRERAEWRTTLWVSEASLRER